MDKNFFIITTGNGKSYARKIRSSLNWINRNIRKFRPFTFHITILSVNELDELIERPYSPESLRNTIIHSRAAYPNNSANWMRQLEELESRGYTIINNINTLKLTSDKLRSAQLFREHFGNYPRTFELSNEIANNDNLLSSWFSANLQEGRTYVVKPYTSLEQGLQVQRFTVDENYVNNIFEMIREVSSPIKIIQEYVDYCCLYRVIVIGGHALPYSFVDRKVDHSDNWKVSVCLNHNMHFVPNPDSRLLRLAEQAQELVGGDINFVDIFHTANQREFIISEINTACNLSIHERKAELAHHPESNIHYRIARYLAERSYENT